MKPCTENKNKSVCLLFPSPTICLIDYSLPTMRVIVYWEHISLSVSSTLSESVITMAQISAGSPLLSRLRRAWKRISGVGCQPIRPWALYPLKANSHSACLNILLNPCPLRPPPPSSPFQSPSPLHDCKPKRERPSRSACSPNGWVGCRCRLDGLWETRGSLPLLVWTAPSLLWSTLRWGSPLTITHPNLIMQISTSKSNTL